MLDIRSMEELFSHVDKRASIRSSRVLGLKNHNSMDLVPQESQVNISGLHLGRILTLLAKAESISWK